MIGWPTTRLMSSIGAEPRRQRSRRGRGRDEKRAYSDIARLWHPGHCLDRASDIGSSRLLSLRKKFMENAICAPPADASAARHGICHLVRHAILDDTRARPPAGTEPAGPPPRPELSTGKTRLSTGSCRVFVKHPWRSWRQVHQLFQYHLISTGITTRFSQHSGVDKVRYPRHIEAMSRGAGGQATVRARLDGVGEHGHERGRGSALPAPARQGSSGALRLGGQCGVASIQAVIPASGNLRSMVAAGERKA